MPRQARKESGTGIFHVMMRGINHQNIFEDAEDNYQFINTLDRMRKRYDDDGNPCGTNCSFYAYCLKRIRGTGTFIHSLYTNKHNIFPQESLSKCSLS